MPFKLAPLMVEDMGAKVRLLRPLHYQGNREGWIVPAGFSSDYASIPRPVRWLFEQRGKWSLPAILHDWFCDVGIPQGLVSPRDADKLFRKFLGERQVGTATRWALWVGVRWGALFSRDGYRRPGILPDLPVVVLLSLPLIPLVVPVSVAVLLVTAVWRLVDALFDQLAKVWYWLYGSRKAQHHG